jgi:putative endopeptidase
MRKVSLAALVFLQVAVLAQNSNSGIKKEYIDDTENPRNDFYKWANGKWLKNTQIPASESRYGSFNEINDRNQDNIKSILFESAADKTAKPGSEKKKVGDFFSSAMDTMTIEKLGLTPIQPTLAMVAAVKTKTQLFNTMASLHKINIGVAFGMSIDADLKNSNMNLPGWGQDGIGLPDRDYYFLPKYEKVKQGYENYVYKIFRHLGKDSLTAMAAKNTILKIETELAKSMLTRVQQRDIESQYTKLSLVDIKKKYPKIDFTSYLVTVGLPQMQEANMAHPKFFEKLNGMIDSISIADWKTYMQFHTVSTFANALPKKFADESFVFYSTALQGVKVKKPRWKSSLERTDRLLGEALGKVFVEKFFPASSKAKVNKLVDDLFAAYKERIMTRTWMSDSTKVAAIYKLEKITRKLAYPDKWKDYTKLNISRTEYVKNIMNAGKFYYDEMLSYYGKPVDKTKWGMTPPTVNAYYNPSANEIAFPAGIMQIPFFDANADDAANYGMIGAVIGHELTHGFDDQGAQFDAVGNFKNWWGEKDKENFLGKTKLIIEQFNNYVAIDTLHVNGELTQGENIADLGGLTMAYYAYKKSLNGKPSPKMDGFTGEQRFFISWAQGWKSLLRDEALKQRLATDPHSPGQFRGNGPLSNMKEFYQAFDVKPGDGMYRSDENRVEIW